jgi:hypothetical protein
MTPQGAPLRLEADARRLAQYLRKQDAPMTKAQLIVLSDWGERRVRKAVETACSMGFPIVSGSHRAGYSWAKNRVEAQEAIRERRSRANALNKTANAMESGLGRFFPIQQRMEI